MDTARNDEDAAMLSGFDSGNDDDQFDDEGAPSHPSGSSSQPQGDAPSSAGQQTQGAKSTDAPSPSDEPATDPFAGLPDAVKKLLAEVPTLRSQNAALVETQRRLDGQVRSFQSQFDKLSATQATAEKPTGQRFEKLQRARETIGIDLPEVMEALDEFASMFPAEAPATQPTQQTAQVIEQSPGLDPAAQAHIDALDTFRPGWFDELESAECKLWLTQQPVLARRHATMQTAADAMAVLKEFDKFREQTQTSKSQSSTRQTRIAAAVTQSGGSRAPQRSAPSTEDDDMAAGFNS